MNYKSYKRLVATVREATVSGAVVCGLLSTITFQCALAQNNGLQSPSVFAVDVAYYCESNKGDKSLHLYGSNGRFYLLRFSGELGKPSESREYEEIGDWTVKNESADGDRGFFNVRGVYSPLERRWLLPEGRKWEQVYAASKSERRVRVYLLRAENGQWKTEAVCVQTPGNSSIVKASLQRLESGLPAARSTATSEAQQDQEKQSRRDSIRSLNDATSLLTPAYGDIQLMSRNSQRCPGVTAFNRVFQSHIDRLASYEALPIPASSKQWGEMYYDMMTGFAAQTRRYKEECMGQRR